MSSTPFRTRIRKAIADEPLQAALDANAERRTTGRAAAFASLPDWQARRERAHAVRAEVIAHLDDYVQAFAARLEANGVHVHHAADACQAIETVLEIARTSQTRVAAAGSDAIGPREGSHAELLFAKSKSMVTEEIELNRALGDHGYRVVETDLGEYIVQLRGEKPAHIITPAVHLQRRQIGELFHEKLGMDFTDDIPTLTAAARKVLRNVFLTADVGISGVNFGVAATGTLCIVTNEGNGRMVTTVPPVHIALMGMERLVPTLDDLALMLSLLPRSATGQKLSVYTQLIHSPRRHGEVDGAAERHVIILDNGRSRIGRSGLREALYCIRCGACLNACPVFREIGGHAYVGADGEPAPYPGPIGSVISPGLLGLQEFGHLAQASSLCGACKDACPVNIDLPRTPDEGPRRRALGCAKARRHWPLRCQSLRAGRVRCHCCLPTTLWILATACSRRWMAHLTGFHLDASPQADGMGLQQGLSSAGTEVLSCQLGRSPPRSRANTQQCGAVCCPAADRAFFGRAGNCHPGLSWRTGKPRCNRSICSRAPGSRRGSPPTAG